MPWLYYVAVDDGTGDRTTAWGLPPQLVEHAVPGTTVRCTVRRWSRRVLDVTPVEDTVADPIASAGGAAT